MGPSKALRLVDQIRDVKGDIRNVLIPRINRAELKRVQKIMETPAGCTYAGVHMINPGYCLTFQEWLYPKRLKWHIRNFDRNKTVKVDKHAPDRIKSTQLPIMFDLDKQPVIWNGNHWAAAAILLDEDLWCVLYRPKSSRLSTLRYVLA